MTSTTDEIAALRAALTDIRDWCENTLAAHESMGGGPHFTVCTHLAAMARRGLKTPRASKLVEPDDSDAKWRQELREKAEANPLFPSHITRVHARKEGT